MKKIFLAGLLVLGCCATVPGFALELSDAKQRGLVGEQRDGMLGAVNAPTPEVQALISEINSKRTTAYANIAKQNGTDVETVKQLAGKKAIEKTPAGQYVKPASTWILVR